MEQWEIGIPAWIIQDGPYSDFYNGQTLDLAVEMYTQAYEKSQSNQKGAEYIEPAIYLVNAEVVFIGPEDNFGNNSFIFDFGILAWGQNKLPARTKVGNLLQAIVYLEVSYDVIPEVIKDNFILEYRWKIDRITRQAAPVINSLEPKTPNLRIRNPSKLGYIELEKTDAWTDDGGNAEYFLLCSLL